MSDSACFSRDPSLSLTGVSAALSMVKSEKLSLAGPAEDVVALALSSTCMC